MFVKKVLPHLIALALFAIVSLIYFAPQYEGRVVRAVDDVQAKGMTGGIAEHKAKFQEHPQWAPNAFGGMPAYLIDMNYDGRLIKEASHALYVLGRPASYYFLMMAGFYFMLLCFGVNPYLALVGGLGYGLSSYFYIIFEAGHITKLMALIYIAPMIGAVFLAYTRRFWLGASLVGIIGAIEISTSHPQIPYYFLFVVFGLFIVQLVRYIREHHVAEFLKRTAVLLVVALLAIGANLVQLWYINDYTADSTRGKSELVAPSHKADNQTSGLDKDYITAWSYGKAETLNLFIPNLYGGSSSGGFSTDGAVAQSLEPYNATDIATQLPGYWGPQPFTSGPVYIGAVMIFLFVLGLFLVKGAIKWWLVGVTALSIMLAWGHNFMWLTDIFIDYMPAYNRFRTISMILVIAEWSIPFLGILALKEMWDKSASDAEIKRAIKLSLYICGGIALFVALFGQMFFSFVSSGDAALSKNLPEEVMGAIRSERADLMRADAFRSLLFVAAAALLLLAVAYNKLTIKKGVIVLAGLVLIDMVPIDLRYLNHDNFISVGKKGQIITPTSADITIMADTDPNFRVANLTTNPFMDATTSYFHKSIGGYHAAKLRRYQDFIDSYLSKMDMKGYNMLNTKYFIHSSGDSLLVQLNDGAYGNCWFVDSIAIVDGANQELADIATINPRRVAVVDSRFKEQVAPLLAGATNPDSTATIALTDYRANHLTYTSQNSRESLAVFSEIYYAKGWVAYIDGKEVPYLRADYILRALVVPEGSHTIEFKFAAPHFNLVYTITLFSSIALLLMFVVAVALEIIGRYKNRAA